MRTLLTALTALMLLATPVVAGDYEDASAAHKGGDHQKAFRLLKPLAEQGDADAQALLGYKYHQGLGVPKDDAKAYYWWRKAAEQGNASAQFLLGAMYAKGEGVTKVLEFSQPHTQSHKEPRVLSLRQIGNSAG